MCLTDYSAVENLVDMSLNRFRYFGMSPVCPPLFFLRLFYRAAKTATPIKMMACSKLLHRRPKSLSQRPSPRDSTRILSQRSNAGRNTRRWVWSILRCFSASGERRQNKIIICIHFLQHLFAFCYELIFRIQPSCFNSFDADYTVTGVEFIWCMSSSHYCLFGAQHGLSAAMGTDAVNLNSPTACQIQMGHLSRDQPVSYRSPEVKLFELHCHNTLVSS